MRIRLTQVDGKLPNLALMKLSHFHKDRGDDVIFSRSVHLTHDENGKHEYERVYASAIFNFSANRVTELKEHFPQAIVGGTWNMGDVTTIEQLLEKQEYENYDYTLYPDFNGSIGFSARGCRLKCGFCVVPKKEGKPRSVNTIADIWRGDPWPKHIHLLDNDFFGQPREQWETRVSELREGKFKVCFNQGINIRMIDDASAAALGTLKLFDDQFKYPRLYTAWDNIGDEKRFFNGVELLTKHGVKPYKLMVYMLIGYDPRETWERVFYRFNKMTALRIRPFPMIYGDRTRTLPLGGYNGDIANRQLREFQRWVIRKAYTFVPFEDYDVNAKGTGAVVAGKKMNWKEARREVI